MPGSRLDANYWWRNVREPVQFADAVRAAARLGARYFVEIGAASDLAQAYRRQPARRGERLRDAGGARPHRWRRRSVRQGARQGDRQRRAASTPTRFLAPIPGRASACRSIRGSRTPFRFKPTVEAVGAERERHPFARRAQHGRCHCVAFAHRHRALSGARRSRRRQRRSSSPARASWRSALAVAREWLKSDSVVLTRV